jgi:hypothetical protein
MNLWKEVTARKGKQATGRPENPHKDDVPLGCSTQCDGYGVCYATAPKYTVHY